MGYGFQISSCFTKSVRYNPREIRREKINVQNTAVTRIPARYIADDKTSFIIRHGVCYEGRDNATTKTFCVIRLL